MTEQKWIEFNEGNLKGLTVYSTEEYIKNYIGGNIDPEMMEHVSRLPIENKIIFDVGAFNGLSSLVFSKLSGKNGRVLSFEPNEFNLERMQMNLNKNPEYSKKIATYQFALSNENAHRGMVISKDVEGPSSTSRLNNAHAKITTNNLPSGFFQTTVDTIRLDDFISNNQIIPDIIKIDIEGAEHLMLLGSIETLNKYNPVLFIEIHSEYCAITCYQILNACNYNIKIISEEADNRIMIEAIKSKNNKEPAIYLPGYIENSILLESLTKELTYLKGKLSNFDQSLLINTELNDTKNQLIQALNTLNGIYSSKSWCLIKKIRRIKKLFGTRGKQQMEKPKEET